MALKYIFVGDINYIGMHNILAYYYGMKNLFKSAMADAKKIHKSIENRVDMREFRVESLNELRPIVKNAFDTRRINQDTEYNPRRNLQNYHRSEPFITKESSEKIKTFLKLKSAVDSIKEDFLGDPEWLDSYCRILSASLDRTLRVDQKDMDFFKPQMDYLEELLYLRYRLKSDDIIRLNEREIKNLILDKDEKLLHKQIYANYNDNNLHKQTYANYGEAQPIKQTGDAGQDNLVDKLFGNVKASKDNKEVQRSVTITVNDKIVEDLKKEG